MGIASVSEALSTLRWNVKVWGKPIALGPGLEVSLYEDRESPSILGLQLRFGARVQRRTLIKEHVKTSGRSQWFRGNTWRLSEVGVAFFTPSIEAVIAKLEASGPGSNSGAMEGTNDGYFLADLIRAGDKVTIVDRFGKQHTGRAVMLGPAGWVLNMGGRHGTPAIASRENVVKVVVGARRGGSIGSGVDDLGGVRTSPDRFYPMQTVTKQHVVGAAPLSDDSLYSTTEADEGATTRYVAFRNFVEKVRALRKGEETMGVVQMYEDAARRMGVEPEKIHNAWNEGLSRHSHFGGLGHSFKAEVIADNSGNWVGNALRFASREEAEAYGQDLESRWTLVRKMRVVESEDPVNYKFVEGRVQALGAQ